MTTLSPSDGHAFRKTEQEEHEVMKGMKKNHGTDWTDVTDQVEFPFGAEQGQRIPST